MIALMIKYSVCISVSPTSIEVVSDDVLQQLVHESLAPTHFT